MLHSFLTAKGDTLASTESPGQSKRRDVMSSLQPASDVCHNFVHE